MFDLGHSNGLRFLAIPQAGAGGGVDPWGWVLGVAMAPAQALWTTLMMGLWQAALWVLQLAFTVVDALSRPDVSATGPLAGVLPTTLWIGGVLAVVMVFVQVGVALIRRDGAGIGRVLVGVAQFAIVWAGYLGVAAGAVAAASALEQGILHDLLGVDTLAAAHWTQNWPHTNADLDAVTATVLGVSGVLLVIPAAFFDLLIALVRDAALLVLVATAPISAAGLMHETNRAWLWKTTRWFIAATLIGPLSALVFGIGVQISNGVVQGRGDTAAGQVGAAVVGAVLVAVGACCPLVLFRLLAFVDPSTVSGAALRQAWTDTTARADAGSGSVAGVGGGSSGEAAGAAATSSRFADVTAALGMVGRGVQLTTGVATRAVDVGTDVLGAAGVGHPGYSLTPADERALRATGTDGAAGSGDQPLPPPASPNPVAPPPAGPVPAAGSASGAAGVAGADASTAAAGVMVV